MRKEQLLLLALLAVLFRPASGQDHPDDDYCHVKTSIVLKKLDTCDSQKIKDDFRRNQLWTDVVKETIGEMMTQLREEMKSQSDHLTDIQEKIEDGMKSNLEMKATMDRILQSDETKRKQLDDLLQGHDKMKSTMDRTLLSIEENKKQERACQRMLASWSFGDRNMTMFFKATGRTFYCNETQKGSWYENRDWCSSRGMQLATLKTADEVKEVANILKSKISSSTNNWFWVSASDIGRSAGQYHWADGTPVLNSTWHSGEPNQFIANQETCTCIDTGYKKLYDAPCSETWNTLCEVPELLATCL